MTLAIIAAFLVLFIVVVGSATLGMRLYDQRRKKQVTDMLKSVSPGRHTAAVSPNAAARQRWGISPPRPTCGSSTPMPAS